MNFRFDRDAWMILLSLRAPATMLRMVPSPLSRGRMALFAIRSFYARDWATPIRKAGLTKKCANASGI